MKKKLQYGVVGFTVATALAIASSAEGRAAAPVDLSRWTYESHPDGWMASDVMDTEVRGSDGRELGEVLNLILDSNGKVKSLIVESGGVLDIGDNHFRVPWSQVHMAPDHEAVVVPISKDNVDERTLYDGEKLDDPVNADAFRARDLLRAFVTLANRRNYGVVTDLAFSSDGQLQAVLAQPAANYVPEGEIALPYDKGFYDRDTGTWRFPYDDADVKKLKPARSSAVD